MFDILKKLFKKRVDYTTEEGFIEFLKQYSSELKINSVAITPNILGVHNLRYLTSINLSNANLKEIPKRVFDLYNLKELNLRNNSIKEIPQDLTRLENLEYLDLGYNKIETIPTFICFMPSLYNLILLEGNWIEGNPIKNIPLDSAESLASMREYFSDLGEI
jgi:Leucine-rich repeat (LRR) protein